MAFGWLSNSGKARSPLLSRKPRVKTYALPAGERVYAIGDVHGRSDCFDELIRLIDADDAARGPANTTLVFLGDFVDRGPNSRGVVDSAMALAQQRSCVFLMGNHEEILLKIWEGDSRTARLFHNIGGRATLLSYGVDPDIYDRADVDELATLTAAHVPDEHIAFLRRFRDSYQLGDYLFVHAGIKPGVPMEEQSPSDLRWIRRPFLDDTRSHGAVVVHGHTVTEDVEQRPNRIGIDTGAFASGVLTALGIEGEETWFLKTGCNA